MLRRLAFRIPPIRRFYERVDLLAAEVDALKVAREQQYDVLVDLVGQHVEVLLPRARLEAEEAMRSALTRAGLSPEIEPELYLALENRFRGDAATITDRLEVYLPFVKPLAAGPYPLVDLGAGRGEWLRMVMDHGIACHGVDDNPAMVAEAREAGIEVLETDLVVYLQGAPTHSVGALTLFHVLEHLPFGAVTEVFRQAARVLAPGGVLVAETPNAANIGVAASTFWVDPTHVRPLYPSLLEFLSLECGFDRVQYLLLHPGLDPPAPSEPPQPLDETVGRLWDALFGPQDLGFVSWTAH